MHSILRLLLLILKHLRNRVLRSTYRGWVRFWAALPRRDLFSSLSESKTQMGRGNELHPKSTLSFLSDSEDKDAITVYSSTAPRSASQPDIRSSPLTSSTPQPSLSGGPPEQILHSSPIHISQSYQDIHSLGRESEPESRLAAIFAFEERLTRSPRDPSRLSLRAPQKHALQRIPSISRTPSLRGTYSRSINSSFISDATAQRRVSNRLSSSWSVHSPALEIISPSTKSSTIGSNPASFPSLPKGRLLYPVSAIENARYQREVILDSESAHYEIPSFTTKFPHLEDGDHAVTREWELVIHLEGSLYFYHRQKRIYTDAYLYHDETRQEIELFADYIDAILQSSRTSLPSVDYEIVLDLRPVDHETIYWLYYCVDHASRSIFWPERYVADHLVDEVKGSKSFAHLKLMIEYNFWSHWALFPKGPRDRQFPSGACDELLGMLVHSCIDSMTSSVSTAPYSKETLQTMIGLVKEASEVAEPNMYMKCCISRIMSFYAHWRFLHFHGQNAARMDSDRSIHYSTPRPRSWLIAILSPIFFWAPEIHLSELDKLWVDEIVYQVSWKRFIDKLQSEWQEFIVFATILLNANVAFLAIPGVINQSGSNSSTSQTLAATVSYVSTTMSIGSIILGLLLVRQHRTRIRPDGPFEAAIFLQNRDHPKLGLEPLAIIYSIPYALLMWAMVTFLTALLILCFKATELWTRIPVGLASLAITTLVIAFISSSWETQERANNWLDTIKGGGMWMRDFTVRLCRSTRARTDTGIA